MVAFRRDLGFRDKREQEFAETLNWTPEMDRPPKVLPRRRAEYQQSDLIALAWIASMLVAGLVGFIAGVNR